MTQLIKRFACWAIRRRLGPVTGLEELPANGYIIASNHVDYLDGFFINVAVLLHDWSARVKFISLTGNYWWMPGKTIPLSRFNGADVLGPACEALRRGDVIVNFPEGRRGEGNGLGQLKSGTARLALLAGVPVVPCILSGPSGRSFLRSLILYTVGRKKMAVRFGKSMPVGPQRDEGDQRAAELTRELDSRLRSLSTGVAADDDAHVLA